MILSEFLRPRILEANQASLAWGLFDLKDGQASPALGHTAPAETANDPATLAWGPFLLARTTIATHRDRI